ncbi:MAG TPA: hypothetical protein VL524_10310 [Gemmatimonadaceae bacterium]|jgi:hypothetical protein|nr:hypothetical protein [Gemmatimonadaceae bacterium]
MPIVPFESLPNDARVWVFASDHALSGAVADTLLASVDQFLSEWKAHGVPLRCARDWRDGRFLAIGVDVNAENASGCSIDGLFRTLQELERAIGTRLVGGGRVFYRTRAGIETSSREQFAERVKRGEVMRETPVFDTSVTAAEAWRTRFEQPAGRSWTAAFF